MHPIFVRKVILVHGAWASVSQMFAHEKATWKNVIGYRRRHRDVILSMCNECQSKQNFNVTKEEGTTQMLSLATEREIYCYGWISSRLIMVMPFISASFYSSFALIEVWRGRWKQQKNISRIKTPRSDTKCILGWANGGKKNAVKTHQDERR